MKKTITEDQVREWLEAQRWPEGVRCPQCGSGHPIYKECRGDTQGYYRCPGKGSTDDCSAGPLPHPTLVFTVRTGTILTRSHTPLSKWLYFMKLYVASQGYPDPTKVSNELRINRRTAIRMSSKIDELISQKPAGQDTSNEFLRDHLRNVINAYNAYKAKHVNPSDKR